MSQVTALTGPPPRVCTATKINNSVQSVTDSHGGPQYLPACVCFNEEKQLSRHWRKPPIIHPVLHIYHLLYAAEVQPSQSSCQRLNVSIYTSRFPHNSKLAWRFIHILPLSVWSYLGCSGRDSHSHYSCCGSTSCCSRTVCHHPTSSSPAGEIVDLLQHCGKLSFCHVWMWI